MHRRPNSSGYFETDAYFVIKRVLESKRRKREGAVVADTMRLVRDKGLLSVAATLCLDFHAPELT